MFNPLYPFTEKVLHASVERGNLWFVRNEYPHGLDDFNTDVKRNFIITHYNDPAKASAHFNSINNDPYRFLYSWQAPEHKAKLKIAANDPPGYKVYSAYFIPGYKDRISTKLKAQINQYIGARTDWKPVRGTAVKVDFFLQFGQLFITLHFGAEELKIRFAEIENIR